MEEKKKNYRKVPPYMTKTGIQIGLLYQEPFETRSSKDADAFQLAMLEKRLYKPKNHINVDWVIVFISVVALFLIIVGGIYGLL